MIRWLLDRWRAEQRAIDLRVLWPVCKREAQEADLPGIEPLEAARAAFAIHAFNDPAWRRLGDEEIMRRIDDLR